MLLNNFTNICFFHTIIWFDDLMPLKLKLQTLLRAFRHIFTGILTARSNSKSSFLALSPEEDHVTAKHALKKSVSGS